MRRCLGTPKPLVCTLWGQIRLGDFRDLRFLELRAAQCTNKRAAGEKNVPPTAEWRGPCAKLLLE